MRQFRQFALLPLLICFLILSCAKDNPVAPTEPAAPSHVTATIVSGTVINLTWGDASDNETGFKIERKTGAGGAWAPFALTVANVVFYQNSGLVPNTTYYYRILAFNGAGFSAYSNEASATTPQVPPIAPSDLSAAAVSVSQINLLWIDRSDSEDGFKIERKTGAGGAWSPIAQSTAGVTSYQNTGLDGNTSYWYRVVAYNSAGNSAYSNEASATTRQIIPAAPSNLSAAAVSSSQINLTWFDGSNNEDGFRIERKAGVGGSWLQIAQTPVGVSYYQDTGLTPNIYFYYRVLAFNSAGVSPPSNEVPAISQIRPAAPSNLSASAVSSSRIDLNWSDNSNNEDGFKVERKTGAGGQWEELVGELPPNTNSAYNQGLTPNTTYYYRVRAYNIAGYSAYSNEVIVTTGSDVPVAPSDLRAETVSSSIINLFWTDNSNNESGFKFERKIGAGGPWGEIGEWGANETSCSVNNLIPNTSYYFRMRAYNAAGNSGYSNVAGDSTDADAVFSDNFENDPVGQQPNDWAVTETGSSTCRVTASRSYPAGGKSVKITDGTAGANSVVMSKTHSSLITARVSAWLYFPAAGDFGVCGWDVSAGNRTFDVEFASDGNLYAMNGANAQMIMANYPVGRWFHFEIVENASTDKYTVLVDGENRATNFDFMISVSSLSRFYFVGFNNATVAEVEIDNVVLTGNAAGVIGGSPKYEAISEMQEAILHTPFDATSFEVPTPKMLKMER